MLVEILEEKIINDDYKPPISICVMSDLHGNLPYINKKVDLVIICGDQVPLAYQANSDKTKNWYLRIFKKWAESLPCKKVLFIAGNHDFHLKKDKQWVQDNFGRDNKVTYLEDEIYIYENRVIYGTPYCKKFGNWAYMYMDDILTNLFSNIPQNVDILITHDAPYGVSDILLDKEFPLYTGEHIGNKPLRDAIESRNIDYNFHGHLHSTNHKMEKLGNTKVYNTSVLDEKYELYYYPLYLYI